MSNSDITLEQLAAMIANGFAATATDIAELRTQMATKANLDALRDEVNGRFVGLSAQLGNLQSERIVALERRIELIEHRLER